MAIDGGATVIETLLQTNIDYVCTFLRLIGGIIIFPYGMQKLFGWFDGMGIKGTLEQIAIIHIPKPNAWLVNHRAVSIFAFFLEKGFPSR
jgi:putative oxidoreductase